MGNTKDAQEKKFLMMTTQPVEGLIGKMAVPSIVSMLVSSIYNMVDTMFVGRISTQATAGVGVVFSFMALIQAVGFFFGHGSGNYITRALGRRDTENAKYVASTGFFSGLIVGLIIAFFGLLFMNPILRFLGATETVLEDARGYFFYIALGAPFIITSFVMNLQMRLQGNALVAMFGISAGAVLNCVLDPILIFGLGMGVRGASLATALSQFVSFVLLLALSGRNGGIKIKFSSFRPHFWHYSEILAGGLPSLGRQGIASIATICLNRIAGGYGDAVLAAFAVVNKFVMFASSILLGFGQGFQPVCGFNFGAKLFDRVRRAFWFSVIVGTIYCTVACLFAEFFAPYIVAFFRDDPEVIYYGTRILRYHALSMPLTSYIVLANMFLQTIKKPVRATVVSVCRQGIVFLPVLYLLNALIGLDGTLFAQPVADVLTLLVSLPLCMTSLANMEKESA